MLILENFNYMLEQTTIKQTALDYLLSNLEVLPEHRHLFEVVGATHFNNNEWMINISIVGLVGQVPCRPKGYTFGYKTTGLSCSIASTEETSATAFRAA